MNQNKEHWEKIYQTKRPDEVSWWQDNPKISLDFIHQLNLPKSAEIIDVGGGDSKLVDCLLEEGFEHITVLDISEEALNRAKQRLGNKAKKVNWISSDITEFEITSYFDVWHDRAAFHFLITEQQIAKYISVVGESIKHNGYLIVGTFSDNGPKKCSGLDVKQYSEETLSAALQNDFDKIRCMKEDHITPFNTIQNFLFCLFKRHADN
jgi:2-polyprenyl-3-methyl-5-hydroxy-6-metoxy-1,4-benzoquinol methylase